MKKLLLLALALFSFGSVQAGEIPPSSIDTTTLQSPFFIVTTETEKVKYELKKCNTYDIKGNFITLPINDLISTKIKNATRVYINGTTLYIDHGVLNTNCVDYSTYFIESIQLEKEPVYISKIIKELQVLSNSTVIVESLVNTGKSLVEFKTDCIQETPGSKLKTITFQEVNGKIDIEQRVQLELSLGEKSGCFIKSITDYFEPVIEPVVQEQQEEILSGNETDPRIEMFANVREKYIKENGRKKAIEIAKKFVVSYLGKQGKLGNNEEIGKAIYKLFTDYISSN